LLNILSLGEKEMYPTKEVKVSHPAGGAIYVVEEGKDLRKRRANDVEFWLIINSEVDPNSKLVYY
jgi:hypothetical protein